MNLTALRGFSDELEKLALADESGRLPPAMMATRMRKEAAMMHDVGNPIVQTGNPTGPTTGVGGWVRRQFAEVGDNIGSTVGKAVSHPLQGMREGLHRTINDLKPGGPSLGHKLQSGAFAAMTAYGLYEGAKDVMRHDEKRGLGERLGNFVGSQAGGLIGTPHGISGMMAGTLAGGKALSLVGRGVDRFVASRRAKRQGAQQFAPGQVQAGPEMGYGASTQPARSAE